MTPPRPRRSGGLDGLAVLLDDPEHLGGAGGVVVGERSVVGFVDVAGGQLGVEVGQAAQQEVPLLLQRGEPVGRGSVSTTVALAVRVGRAVATRARSSSVARSAPPAPADERSSETGHRDDGYHHRQDPDEAGGASRTA